MLAFFLFSLRTLARLLSVCETSPVFHSSIQTDTSACVRPATKVTSANKVGESCFGTELAFLNVKILCVRGWRWGKGAMGKGAEGVGGRVLQYKPTPVDITPLMFGVFACIKFPNM